MKIPFPNSIIETELFFYEGKWRQNEKATLETADYYTDTIIYNDTLKPHQKFFSELKRMDIHSNIKRLFLPYPEPQPQFGKSIDMIVELIEWVEKKAHKTLQNQQDYCLLCKAKLGLFIFEIPWLNKKIKWHQGYKHYLKIHRCLPSLIFIEALGHYKKNFIQKSTFPQTEFPEK